MNLVPGEFPQRSGYLIKDKLFTPASELRSKFIPAYKHQLWKKVCFRDPDFSRPRTTLIRGNTSLIAENLQASLTLFRLPTIIVCTSLLWRANRPGKLGQPGNQGCKDGAKIYF